MADQDPQWIDGFNWKTGHPHTTGAVPNATQSVYITSSDHIHQVPPNPPGPLDPLPSILDGGFLADSGQIYVGGWDEALDVDHGNPDGHYGQLDIVDGHLEISEQPGGSPPCNYLRVGFRGADGVINQSGGSVWGCTYFSMAFKSPDSLGTWNLTGGVVETYGIDVGVMGTGIIMMDGGQVIAQTRPNHQAGRTNIGRGYHREEDGYETGVGLIHQRGGSFANQEIRIGEGIGAVGIHVVRQSAIVDAPARLDIGWEGQGSLVQSGGSVSGGRITIGQTPKANGLYTISGGTLNQYGANQWFLTGSGSGGVGHLMIIGSDPSINVVRYYQNEYSRLTVMLDKHGEYISPIVVDQTADLRNGTVIDVELAPAGLSSAAPDFVPTALDAFKIIAVENGSLIDRGAVLAAEDENDWKLEKIGNELRVRYCPETASLPSCAAP